MALQTFSGVFTSVLDVCYKCFKCFRWMLQMSYLDVAKVERVLHLPPRFLLPRLGVPCPFSMLVMFGQRGPLRGVDGVGGASCLSGTESE